MMERNEFEVWAKGRFSLDWNYCGQVKPGDYVAERTREAWSAWQSSSSRLREGLRELADSVKELIDWMPTCSVGSSGYMRRMAVKEKLAALLSLEGDKTGPTIAESKTD